MTSENKKMALPVTRNFARVPVELAQAFGPERDQRFKCYRDENSYSPLELFVDFETPHETHKKFNAPQIHLGVRGLFETFKPYYDNAKGNRLDIYISIDHLNTLILGLIELRNELTTFKRFG